MAFRLKTEIDDAPDHRRSVSTHIVTEQVVSKKEIAGPPQDLFGRLHWVGRVFDIEQRVGPVLAEIGRSNVVRVGPDPEIAHIGRGLVGQEYASQQGERSGASAWLSDFEAVDMRPAGSMIRKRCSRHTLTVVAYPRLAA